MNAELESSLRLVAITDNLRDGVDGLAARAAAAVRGGATMVQLRLKDADARTIVSAARRLVRDLAVPVIVNDRIDIALAAKAAGAHLGADDLPVAVARRIVPAGFIIGASLGSDAEAENARAADYVGIGPVFATGTKPDAGTAIGPAGFARLRALASVPSVGIGGISVDRAWEVIAAGAAGVAVVSAVFGAGDPEEAARTLRHALS